GAVGRLGHSATVGAAVVRKAGAVVLAERRGVSSRAGAGTGAAAASRAGRRGIPGVLLVDSLARVRVPGGVDGYPDPRHVGRVAGFQSGGGCGFASDGCVLRSHAVVPALGGPGRRAVSTGGRGDVGAGGSGVGV